MSLKEKRMEILAQSLEQVAKKWCEEAMERGLTPEEISYLFDAFVPRFIMLAAERKLIGAKNILQYSDTILGLGIEHLNGHTKDD